MKKIYKLLLHVRELEEKQKKKELADAISERVKKEQEIKSLEEEKRKLSSDMKEGEGISAWFLAQFLQYIEGLREDKKHKEKELAQMLLVEDQKRQELLEAKKERNVVENLVERKKAEEKIEEIKKQEKISDELVVLRYREEKIERTEEE